MKKISEMSIVGVIDTVNTIESNTTYITLDNNKYNEVVRKL